VKHMMILFGAAPLLIAAAPSWQERTVASAAPFIEKANDEWETAIVSGKADVLSAPYAKDGVFVMPDGTAIHGRTGVKTMYSRRPTGVKVLHASIKSEARVAPDPDDVYEWGSAQMTLRSKGKTRYVVGRYLTVWHRSGKQWLITRNIAF
jgi:ketosteroid isomerase-like protein